MQVAALKQLLLAGPCIPPHMLVQNDHPLSDYNSQTFQQFNIETTVQDTTCTFNGARTVGLLASTSARSPTVLAFVLILVLALDSVHVH